MKNLKLGTELNISFGLVLFVPMLVAAVFSIVYYSQKIKDEAVNKINTDANMGDIIYRTEIEEVKSLANAYANKKTIVFLLNYRLGEKIGTDLAKYTENDDVDMVTVIDSSYKVLVRSHMPKNIDGNLSRKDWIDKALAGITVGGTEILTPKLLEREGVSSHSGENGGVLAISAAAPIYGRERHEISGAIIVRRIIDKRTRIVRTISKNLFVHSAIFSYTKLVANCFAENGQGDFIPPSQDDLKEVLWNNKPMHVANIAKGGSISKCVPITDFSGKPVGVLMVQTGVGDFLKTRNIAIFTLLGILLIGFVLAFIIKTIIERRLSESHSILQAEIREREEAEQRIRSLNRELFRAQENERRKIALDLHDHVVQELSMLALKYETIIFQEKAASQETRNAVKSLNAILKNAIMSLRNLAYGLRPSSLDEFGLVHTIREFCMDFMRETSISVEFKSSGVSEREFDSEININLYRLVQEAFNNIRKHSGATAVSMKLISSHPNIILRISDNGIGFDVKKISVESSNEKHMGIKSIAERVNYLDGKLNISSAPGKGTKLYIEFMNRGEDCDGEEKSRP